MPHPTTPISLKSHISCCSHGTIPIQLSMGSRNLGNPSPPPPAISTPSKMAELDQPLDFFGFEIDIVSATEVTGRLRVTDRCCQPFKVLHGGVSALISEAMASMGAHVASGFQRIAGVQLAVNHLRPAAVGDLIFARASPVHTGRTIQVWEVLLWKMNPSNMEKMALITSSKVTILANLPIPPNAKKADIALKKYAKL